MGKKRISEQSMKSSKGEKAAALMKRKKGEAGDVINSKIQIGKSFEDK